MGAGPFVSLLRGEPAGGAEEEGEGEAGLTPYRPATEGQLSVDRLAQGLYPTNGAANNCCERRRRLRRLFVPIPSQ